MDGSVGIGADDYDAAHEAVHGSTLMRRLWADAMGDQYPAEVEPFSSCTWWLLGQLVAALRLPAGGLLVDLGCGCGGPGLWLARALTARLVGIDFSPVAVRLASQRAPGFVAEGRAEFRRATFAQTGLPDASVEGAVSVDALPFAPDRPAALREARRILAPGARLAITVRTRPGGPGDWPALAVAADLEVEASEEYRDHDDIWRRLHGSWLAHEREMRAELGERAAENLLLEARQALARTEQPPPAELLILRRPAPA
jgi:SAM-dependent methyltransferase